MADSGVIATERTCSSGSFETSWIESTAPSDDTQRRGSRSSVSACRAYSIDEIGAVSSSPATRRRLSSVGTPVTSSNSASTRKKTGRHVRVGDPPELDHFDPPSRRDSPPDLTVSQRTHLPAPDADRGYPEIRDVSVPVSFGRRRFGPDRPRECEALLGTPVCAGFRLTTHTAAARCRACHARPARARLRAHCSHLSCSSAASVPVRPPAARKISSRTTVPWTSLAPRCSATCATGIVSEIQ